MKELSIEEKAKAYDEALKWMRDLYPNLGIAAKEKAESIFHELCESEDEKIRKEIISFIQDDIDEINLKVSGDYDDRDEDDIAHQNWCKGAIAWLEKQGEQKDFIPKDEPKFKVGDFIVNDYCMGKVIELTNDAYLLDTRQGIPFSCEHNAHLWTIQDARLGDVLACNEEILLFKSYSVQGRISLYCWYNGQTNNFHSKEVVDTLMTTRNKIYPATKKQRDLFFQKMKEAGYEWDAEKKELKKVEKKSQRMISAEAKEAMYNKPTDEDMKEALRTEYEKGRADAFAEIRKKWDDSRRSQDILGFIESLRLKED